MTEIKHLTAKQLTTLTLDEANAEIKRRNEDSYHWTCTADELKAFYALGVRSFTYADLSSADLSSADLSRADLRRANLSYADLSRASLSDADLSDANLRYADLRDADLREANLSDANMSDANLRRADLSRADLRRANLSYADLSRASLSDADLSGANAYGVTRLWTISNIGSRKDTLIAWHKDGELHLHTGCKQDISVQQFRELLAKSSPMVREEYEDALQFLERRLARAMKESK